MKITRVVCDTDESSVLFVLDPQGSKFSETYDPSIWPILKICPVAISVQITGPGQTSREAQFISPEKCWLEPCSAFEPDRAGVRIYRVPTPSLSLFSRASEIAFTYAERGKFGTVYLYLDDLPEPEIDIEEFLRC